MKKENDKKSGLSTKLRLEEALEKLAELEAHVARTTEVTNELLNSKWWRMTRAPRRWSNSLRKLRGRPKKIWPSSISIPISFFGDQMSSINRTDPTHSLNSDVEKSEVRISEPVVRSVAICMIRNEQDIIEPFLRHTSPLVDLIFIMDNCSTDNTRSIIRDTARELGNIVVTDLPDQAYNQSQSMTRAMQFVQSTVFADFIFFLDADEFLSANNQVELFESLDHLPADSVGLIPWKTYLPDSDLSKGTILDPLDGLTLRRRNEDPQYYKAVLRMAGGHDPSLIVAQGNHQIIGAGGEPLDSSILQSLELVHLPLRSTDQLLVKGVIGWEANQKREAHQPGSTEAYQWKRLFEIAESRDYPSKELLLREALNYAQTEKFGTLSNHVMADNHGISTKRHYSDGKFGSPEKLIADSRRNAPGMTAALSLPDVQTERTNKSDVSNAFDGDWHWNFLFLDEPPIKFAIERFNPQSVLDLGCGAGLYLALCSHLGVKDILGVDGLHLEDTVLAHKTYRKADLQEPFDAGRHFDLVTCLEVVEHIEPNATETLIDSIAHHAQGQILFSMAEPGQPGNGHINCKSISDVLELWAKRGWQPDLAATLGIRAISTMSWFRRNVVLLQNTGEYGETAGARALKTIESLPYIWYGQSPGQRVTAFCELYPDLATSYGRVLPANRKSQ